jgi:hypothetical protein
MKIYPRFFLRISPIFFLIIFFLAICGTGNSAPPGGPVALTLPAVKLEAFAELPPPVHFEVTPSLQDSATTVDKATNYKEVVKFLGLKLTEGQKKFLNEHKFLLIPKRATGFKGKMGEYDEMLGMFDAVGGYTLPIERKPENARLVTPDVVLHAFHKYFQNSLEYLETYDLASLLHRFLQQAQARALEYRAASGGQLAERYEVIAAQLTVPLIIMENIQRPIHPDISKPLKNALQLLEKSKDRLSPEVYSRMVQELRTVYEAVKTVPPKEDLYGRPDIVESLKIARNLLEKSQDQFSPPVYSRIDHDLLSAYLDATERAPRAPQEALYEKPAESLKNALRLLEKSKDRFSPPVYGRMAQELRSVYEAKEVAASPLYGQYAKEGKVKTDYTQFTPRGHYAKSSLLRGYFRGMMYLGRNSYFMDTPAGISDALLVAYIMASPGHDGQPLLKDWQRLTEIATFYAGLPDDICYPEWRDFVVKILGTEKFSPAEAVNPETVTKISQHLAELSPPRILSEVIISESVPQATKEELLAQVKAFRIFGQRFSFDGWILNRLSGGVEKAEVRLPSTPSALFVPAALGDKAARGFAAPFLKQDTPPFSEEEIAGFSRVLDRVAADLKKVKEGEWFSSVGAAWLKPLGALTGTFGSGYPLYMQDKLFPVKQLQTFLGSFTELKHDTLLYVKQSFAEAEGPEEKEPPPVPKGFVEPNLAFWGELQRLVAYTRAGFSKYGIFKGELEEFGRITRFEKDIKSYGIITFRT